MNLDKIELYALPWIFLKDKKQLPVCAGVYAVTSGDQVLYVGCSANLSTRWGSHHRYEEIRYYDDVKIHWLVIDEVCSLLAIEELLISKFQPILNGKPRSYMQSQELALESNPALAMLLKEGVRRLSLDLPKSMHKRLDAISIKTGWKKAQVARIAIEKFLAQVESEFTNVD